MCLINTADWKAFIYFSMHASACNFIFIKENRWKYYVRGLGLTILVSLLSVVVGVLLGLIVAVARIDAQRKNKKTIFSMIASAYVDIIRGTPSVLQLMIIYFGYRLG